MNLKKLVILPSLKAKKISDTQIILSQKFIDGMRIYQEYWSGTITLLIEEDQSLNDNLDNVSVDIKSLPFKVEIIAFKAIQENQELLNASVVLATEGFRQNHISKICKLHKIPCIYVTEYSFKTRIQIINATTKNFAIRLRRYVWQISQELKQRKAIREADGVQCNGTPTYEAYRTINSNALLYFDTRITEDMLASEAEINKRTAQCLTNSPLRLLFSGRLITIKGADHLILVAENLKKLGVEFEMFICGDGDLRESMEKSIQQKGLSNPVKLLGVLDFKSELVPFAKNNIDLFVCCHRQGDPSCTYLETMSCGIPIVGYANEALTGIIQYSQSGWSVTMDRADLLSQKISELNKNRKVIVDKAFNSLDFAKMHTFEKTFQERIYHIEKTALYL
ncbi:MAG: glycosyltransferase [Snowella sp.]|nr:glycosyltransferase [Snowella sp.]